MKYKQIWKTAAACLMAAAMLPGCSDEEGGGTVNPEDKYRTLEITINSKNNAEPVGTRADNDDTEDLGNYEHYIDEYWLIVTKRNEQGQFLVDRVISSDDVDVYSQPNNNQDDSETSLSMEVEIGQTYRFYALANLEYLDGGATLISDIESLSENATFEPEKMTAKLQAMTNYKNDDANPVYIPMTSYGYEQEIGDNTRELDKPIELIRLLGKVTLDVTNLTGETITLNGLSMGDFRTTGSIYLFPYDIAEPNDPRNLLSENDYLNPWFPTVAGETPARTATVFVGESTTPKPQIADNATQSFTAYVNETRDESEQGGNLSDLTITTNVKGKNPNPVESGFSYVRRNDWLQIPVQITNVTTRIEFDQKHMPIGGLPESLEFGKISVPIAYCRTTHGGDITVNFALTEVSGMGSNPQLSFYSGSYEGGTEHYTSAILRDNQNDILIHTPEDNDAAPWLDETEYAIPVTAGSPEAGIIGQGSFTVTAQELAATTNGQAEIELRMVITDGTQYMTIPYTIYITNQSN